MSFEHYIDSGRNRLRCGYTTGTCAALAAKGAVRMLLSAGPVESVSLPTPKGWTVEVPVEETCVESGCASCGVRKDGGDDIDVTSGLLICARVSLSEQAGVHIDGGQGVGRVTRPGLDQPVGAAAINRVPREMIRRAVEEELERFDCGCGVDVIIFVPGGEQAALRTFNPNLGIRGGISILGTSGIVEPRSLQALVDTIAVELKMHRAGGAEEVILTPGNYGSEYLKSQSWSGQAPVVQCSNFIGDAIDMAVSQHFSAILLVGHVGKLVKLAGGIMNTHSGTADCRRELFCAYAALAGGEKKVLEELMQAATSDACISVLEQAGLLRQVLEQLSRAVQGHLTRRAGEGVQIGAVVFSNEYGLLFRTQGAEDIITRWEQSI